MTSSPIAIRPIVFWLPLACFLSMVALSLIDLETFLRVATHINAWIMRVLSDAFAITAFVLVLTCIGVAVSPLGRVRIGGEDATPLISRWNWFAITLSTTLAVGILFWATAEPIYHLYAPGGQDIPPGSPDAARFAQSSLFLHWTFTPYAIYTIPGIAFALAYYNFNKPFSLASPIEVLIGRSLPRWLSDTIDGLGLLGMLFGLSSSLGTGILSISGGLGRIAGLEPGMWIYALVAAVIVVSFFVSSASGLQRGIRILSDWNTKIFLALVLFVFISGPTLAIVTNGFAALTEYGRDFIPRSLVLSPFDDRGWANSWTLFYWANWMAWAPLTAMFLGRIARGYRVREYVLINFLFPALFSMIWMSIFGGLALTIEMGETGVLKSILDASGPEAVLYEVTSRLPGPAIAATLLIVGLSSISYVTAADSNTDALASICLEGHSSDRPSGASIRLKASWAALVGGTAWVMISFSGIDGIRMLSNLGGLPALFIVATFCASVFAMALALPHCRGVYEKTGRENGK